MKPLNGYILFFLLFVCAISLAGDFLRNQGTHAQYQAPKNQPITIVKECSYEKLHDTIRISPWCLISPSHEMLNQEFTKIIEAQRDAIQTFSNMYNEEDESFTYTNAKPVWKDKQKQNFDQYREKKRESIIEGSYIGPRSIQLSYAERQQIIMSHYSYFVTDRDISEYGHCSLNNYYVAAISIDKKYIKPGEIFHLNKRIAHRQGYCKEDEEEFSFYGGVCGAATQVFRIGLLHPEIEIIDREPHRERYSQYYGDTVLGDDAAIAEFYKNLKLKNTSNFPLYFKYREIEADKRVGIVAISPTSSYHNSQTTVIKKNLGPLKASVSAKSKIGEKIYPEKFFKSEYISVYDERVR